MENIKVYMQYPWKFPDSPYYKYLVENPPEGIEYINIEKQEGVITKSTKFHFSNFFKQRIRRYGNKLKLSFLNAHKTPVGDYDLIHCAHCLSKNNFPWVADFEAFWQFWVSGLETKRGIAKARKILAKKQCKKIIAWTEETKKGILSLFPEIENKVEVVYPAVSFKQIKKEKHGRKIFLAFTARYFYRKGGLHALEVFDRLTKKYKNVECLFVSETPQKIRDKYAKNKRIKFFELMPQEELFSKILNKTDIFVYPGYSDTFGFSFLEVMSLGIPIVTVGDYSREEIVENGKCGFVIPQDFIYPDKIEELYEGMIKKILDKTSELIVDKRLRDKMSKNCIKMIKEGKFSIQERNKRLKRIYEEALNEK